MSSANQKAQHPAILGLKILLSIVVLVVGMSVAVLVNAYAQEVGSLHAGSTLQFYFFVALSLPALFVIWRSRGSVAWRLVAAAGGTATGIVGYQVFLFGLGMIARAVVPEPGRLQFVNIIVGVNVVSLVIGFLLMRWVTLSILRGAPEHRRVEAPALAVAESSVAMPAVQPGLEERLERLRGLHQRGLITEEVYAETQREILRQG